MVNAAERRFTAREYNQNPALIKRVALDEGAVTITDRGRPSIRVTRAESGDSGANKPFVSLWDAIRGDLDDGDFPEDLEFPRERGLWRERELD